MRRIACMLAVGAVVLAFAPGGTAQSESLGEVARAARMEKRPPAKKVFTNDNLPVDTTISVVGSPAESTEQKSAAKLEEAKGQPAQKESKTPENKAPQDERGWRDQLSEQKKKIDALEHELDLLQREYKLQIAQYYADVGSQLRDQKKWAEDDVKYRADIAEKQKQLEDAKAQLQDMQEQARKAGMPSSVSE